MDPYQRREDRGDCTRNRSGARLQTRSPGKEKSRSEGRDNGYVLARLVAWRVARGQGPCSAEMAPIVRHGATCPKKPSTHWCATPANRSKDEAPETWLWHRRKVRVVDGSTITMPDTPANQAAYPQQKSQKPGCGFPIARILVVFSLGVGTVLESAIGKYKGKQTGENGLFRELTSYACKGDVVLVDRYFSGWFDLALLRQRGIDTVARKHQLRPTDFRPADDWAKKIIWSFGPDRNDRRGCRSSSTARCPRV